MGPEVWIGSGSRAVPLTSIAWWGDLAVTHRWPLGSWEAKWSMPLAPWQRHPLFKADVPVTIRIGPWPIWTGQLADIGWDDGEMVAVGAARQGESAPAFDNTGATTTILDVAIDQAIADGMVDWTRPASLSAVAFGTDGETDRVNYLAALMDSWATSVSKRWYVDPWRAVRAAVDPTVPSALIIPDSGSLGVANERQAGTVFGRYVDTATGAPATTRYPASGGGRPAVLMNLLDTKPPMSVEDARAICQGVWSQLQAQPGWTNGITVRTGQLLTPGGADLALWRFAAGPDGMASLLGVRDERGLSANTNVVMGESIWTPGEDSLQLKPTGVAARDISSIIEAAGGVAA